MTKKILGDRPNTYTFTKVNTGTSPAKFVIHKAGLFSYKICFFLSFLSLKAMAEQLVQDEGAGLPICIVRPSIVVSTWKVHFK